jgi:hypothetical protein
MNRSAVLTAIPPSVVTLTRPDPVEDGTVMPMAVGVAVLGEPGVVLTRVLLFAGTVSKFAPLMMTAAPAGAMEGVNPEIVGGLIGLPPTVKEVALVADPDGAVTAIGPVVAPAGTVATISVVVLELTAPVTPLNLTVFWLAVPLNPVPAIRTETPAGPPPGEKSMTETSVELWRPIERRFPTASYA